MNNLTESSSRRCTRYPNCHDLKLALYGNSYATYSTTELGVSRQIEPARVSGEKIKICRFYENKLEFVGTQKFMKLAHEA